MANPSITGSMTLKQYSATLDISTATTENLIGNTASSGKLVEIEYLAFSNDDGTNAATIDVLQYNEDGGPIHSDVGNDQLAIGTDTVAGSSLGGWHDIEVVAGGVVVLIDKTTPFRLLEDRSLVIQASAANDLNLAISWTVKG